MTKIDRDNLVRFCSELIQRPSVSGQEQEVALRVQTEMRQLGFDVVWIDSWGNVIGKVSGNGNKKVLFNAHLDTVDVSNQEQWSYPPFGGVIEQGRIYGRGASDMKGALAAMIYAAKELIKDKHKLSGDVYIAGIVYEEIFEGVAFGNVLDQVNPDYVIIGEASELNLKIGQRGRAEISLTAFGKNAHSANPKVGYNAVYAMLKAVQKIMELKLPKHQFLGEAIIELTDIISYPFPGASVVPDFCKATFDRRLLVGEKPEGVLAQIEAIMDELRREDIQFKAKVEYTRGRGTTYTGSIIESTRFFPAWLMEEHSEIVQKSLQALRSAGLNPEISKYSFCTDGSQSAGIRNIPTVGFGPSREELAHVVDEYIEIDQMEQAALGYYWLAQKLLS